MMKRTTPTEHTMTPPIFKTILAAFFLLSLNFMPTQAFAGASHHNISVQNDGTALTWGANVYGQLGDNTTTKKKNPIVVTDALGNTLTGIQSVSAGLSSTVILKNDGTLLAVGRNHVGQLGDGTTANRHVLVVVTDALGNPITGIQRVVLGTYFTVALKDDGTMLAWGNNTQGQLGDGTTVTKVNPVVVADALGNPITGIQSIAAGLNHALALKNDGTMLAWGVNNLGQLGDGTTLSKSNPVVVTDALGSPISGVISVTAGDNYNVALKNDGTMLAWGYNNVGQLGDGTTATKFNPVVVSDALGNPITGITMVSAGGVHTLALKSNGNIAAWGDNTWGKLGDGTSVNRVNPVVLNTGIAISVAAGNLHSLALRSDGLMLAWGRNFYGQLGDGTTTKSFTPLYVRNAAGATITGTAEIMNVMPTDITAPVVTVPVDIYVSAVDVYGTPASNTLITDFLGRATANDVINGTIVPTNNAPITFPIGTTLVTFTATDTAGNTATATANVIVQSLATTAINNIANGATLAGTSQTFTWTDTGASAYRLLVGSTFGGSGYHDTYALAAGTTSVTVTGLPEKGVPVYVRLYAWTAGAWLKNDTRYVGANKPLATVTTPANGTTLAATSQTFSWTDTGADKYFLAVGNFAIGGADLYSSGILPAGTTSVTVNGLPNDGSTVYARLYTWGNGAWQNSDTSYVAMPSTANVNNVTNGATLAATAQTFTWVDTGAPMYYFIVGTAPGLGDIHQSGNLAAGTASANVTGLPAGGVPVYVRLYSWGNGSWNTSNTTYTAAP